MLTEPQDQPEAPIEDEITESGGQPEHRVLVISPVRNEAAHIERVASALAAQQLTPARWIVIDDHSSDGTLERLRSLQRDLPFLTIVRAPRDSMSGAPDRLALAVEARNFNIALAMVDPRAYTHIMKLDGDIELPANYLRLLLERFAEDPGLGLAGGVLVEPTSGARTRAIAIPRHHVHGALKCYSRECFLAIGGIEERLAWDTIDETYARMRGFATRSFEDLVSVHHRPIASADGRLRGRARHGECAYIIHYGPLWVMLRSFKVACSRPLGLSGVAFVYGYARAFALRVERVPDRDFRRFTRRELYGRLVGAVPAIARRIRTAREQRALSTVV